MLLVIKWTIIPAYAFIYLSFCISGQKRTRVGRALTLVDWIVDTAEGETEGSQELWQDSITGQRGHAVNWTTRRLSQSRLAYVKLFHITQAFPEHLYSIRSARVCAVDLRFINMFHIKVSFNSRDFCNFKKRRTKGAECFQMQIQGKESTQQVFKHSETVLISFKSKLDQL